MGSRVCIPALRALSRPRTLQWRSIPQAHRALCTALPLRTGPVTSVIASPLQRNSYRRDFSSTARLFDQDPVPSTDTSPTEQEGVSTKKTSEPLNILFCGSTKFSCVALKALHKEHLCNPELIRSIEVVVRPAKRTGRGRTKLREVPLKQVAEELGLPIHERDTFTGWDMPPETNLIVAVSFGLFVPPRLLHAARYGGLNLHPSLLPDLRGPAPLHHMLLRRRTLAGVSLQTLHPEHFDHGIVLAQTPIDNPPSELRIQPGSSTVDDLLETINPLAADMLIRGLREGVHVPPLVDRSWEAQLQSESEGDSSEEKDTKRLLALRRLGGDFNEGGGLVHAPKITNGDRQVRLSMLLDDEGGAATQTQGDSEGTQVQESTLALLHRAIPRLWFYSVDQRTGRRQRVIIDKLLTDSTATSADDAEYQRRIPQIVAEPPTASTTPPAEKTTPTRLIIPFVDVPSKDLSNTTSTPTNSNSSSESDSNNSSESDSNSNSNDETPNAVPYKVGKITYLSLATGPEPTPGHSKDSKYGVVYLRPDCYVRRLKVEGQLGKPARVALQKFIVSEVEG